MRNYEERAMRFVNQFVPFINGCETVEDFRLAVLCFNHEYKRKVQLNHGMTRVAFITSDYVVKLDYDPEKVRRWGGGREEALFYDFACREGFGYLFAKVTPYSCRGYTFYIMPRIGGIGREPWDADEYMTPTESEWCWDNGLRDLHNYNYGWKDGHIVIIDYGANEFRS